MLKAIVIGGLIAAILDILYAFIVYGPMSYGMSPMDVLRSVAAGWYGRDVARAGGTDIALIGAATHLGIATIMAAVYVIASGALPMLRSQAIVWGFVYGLILYVAMNYVVTPLSAAATGHFATPAEIMPRLQDAFGALRPNPERAGWLMFAGTVFTHTVLVGIPIALVAKRFASSSD